MDPSSIMGLFFLEYSKVSCGVDPITSPGLLSFRSAECPEMCYKWRLAAVASVGTWIYTGAREVFQSYPWEISVIYPVS